MSIRPEQAVSPQDWSAPSFCIMHLACELFPVPPTPWETEVLITRYMRCSCSQQNNNSPLESFFFLPSSCFFFPSLSLTLSPSRSLLLSSLPFLANIELFCHHSDCFCDNREANVCVFLSGPLFLCLFHLRQMIAGELNTLIKNIIRAVFRYC